MDPSQAQIQVRPLHRSDCTSNAQLMRHAALQQPLVHVALCLVVYLMTVCTQFMAKAAVPSGTELTICYTHLPKGYDFTEKSADSLNPFDVGPPQSPPHGGRMVEQTLSPEPRLCESFSVKGFCEKGQRCKFSHGELLLLNVHIMILCQMQRSSVSLDGTRGRHKHHKLHNHGPLRTPQVLVMAPATRSVHKTNLLLVYE